MVTTVARHIYSRTVMRGSEKFWQTVGPQRSVLHVSAVQREGLLLYVCRKEQEPGEAPEDCCFFCCAAPIHSSGACSRALPMDQASDGLLWRDFIETGRTAPE